jgi:RNA polymerase sigma factor (sigma-70 family)
LNQPDEIWLLLKKGDKNAFLQVYEIHYPILYDYGMKLSGEKELTRDCIHEIFTQIWDKRSNLKDVHHIKAYLLKYMRRLILNKLKLHRLNAELEENSNKYLRLEFSPEDMIIGKEDRQEQTQRVLNALSKLSPRQKEIIYLRFYYGLDYQMIQQITSLNYQSLRNVLHKAMTTLRKHLS